MRQHTVIGYNLLREAQKEIEEESIYTLAMEIARYHHEKWGRQRLSRRSGLR